MIIKSLILVLILVGCDNSSELILKNTSNSDVRNLKLYYKSGKKIIELKKLNSNELATIQLNPLDDDTLLLDYFFSFNEECLSLTLGYVSPSDSTDIIVYIKDSCQLSVLYE